MFVKEYKFIRMEERAPMPGRKTKNIEVLTKDGDTLGWVEWYPGWRKYVFAPLSHTAYEQQCLRDIASFIEWATAEHYKNLKAAKAAVTAK